MGPAKRSLRVFRNSQSASSDRTGRERTGRSTASQVPLGPAVHSSFTGSHAVYSARPQAGSPRWVSTFCRLRRDRPAGVRLRRAPLVRRRLSAGRSAAISRGSARPAAGRGRPGPGPARPVGRAGRGLLPPPRRRLSAWARRKGRWRGVGGERGARHGAGLGLEADVVAVLPVPAGHRALHAGALGAHRLQYPSARGAWRVCAALGGPGGAALALPRRARRRLRGRPEAAGRVWRPRRAGVAAPPAVPPPLPAQRVRCRGSAPPGEASVAALRAGGRRRGFRGRGGGRREEGRAGPGRGKAGLGRRARPVPAAGGGAAAFARARGLSPPRRQGLKAPGLHQLTCCPSCGRILVLVFHVLSLGV